jgi:hypothetical protein
MVSGFNHLLSQKTLKAIILLDSILFSLPVITMAQPDFKETICCDGYSPNDSLRFIHGMYHLDSVPLSQFPLVCQVGSTEEQYPELLSDVQFVLSYYPELKGRKIKVYYSSIKQTMNCRPCFENLFVKREKRTYKIIINNNMGKEKGLPIAQLPAEVRIGFIAHEFAHMLTYDQMNNFQTILFALNYACSKEFLYNVERYTDNVAIEHHLARQLFAGSAYCRRSTDLSPKYRLYSTINGLQLDEIICLWQKTACKLP